MSIPESGSSSGGIPPGERPWTHYNLSEETSSSEEEGKHLDLPFLWKGVAKCQERRIRTLETIGPIGIRIKQFLEEIEEFVMEREFHEGSVQLLEPDFDENTAQRERLTEKAKTFLSGLQARGCMIDISYFDTILRMEDIEDHNAALQFEFGKQQLLEKVFHATLFFDETAGFFEEKQNKRELFCKFFPDASPEDLEQMELTYVPIFQETHNGGKYPMRLDCSVQNERKSVFFKPRSGQIDENVFLLFQEITKLAESEEYDEDWIPLFEGWVSRFHSPEITSPEIASPEIASPEIEEEDSLEGSLEEECVPVTRVSIVPLRSAKIVNFERGGMPCCLCEEVPGKTIPRGYVPDRYIQEFSVDPDRKQRIKDQLLLIEACCQFLEISDLHADNVILKCDEEGVWVVPIDCENRARGTQLYRSSPQGLEVPRSLFNLLRECKEKIDPIPFRFVPLTTPFFSGGLTDLQNVGVVQEALLAALSMQKGTLEVSEDELVDLLLYDTFQGDVPYLTQDSIGIYYGDCYNSALGSHRLIFRFL